MQQVAQIIGVLLEGRTRLAERGAASRTEAELRAQRLSGGASLGAVEPIFERSARSTLAETMRSRSKGPPGARRIIKNVIVTTKKYHQHEPGEAAEEKKKPSKDAR